MPEMSKNTESTVPDPVMVSEVISRPSISKAEIEKQASQSIALIPWDPDSTAHVERLRLQRIACGWKIAKVDEWKDLQQSGKIGMHWIALTPSHLETSSRLQKHIKAFPDESTPLADTCRVVLSRPHTPDPQFDKFIPIGHISLDVVTTFPELRASAADGVYSINSFYISRSLQRGGLGAAAMVACERIARTVFRAKTITLSTISNDEMYHENPRRVAMGLTEIPKPTNQDWYTKRGYTIYGHRLNAYHEIDPTGKRWGIKCVFMSKELEPVD
ncbi:hypothetical protein PFICI_14475 [Pestalotiopsis fici W106-1]|uniref:Uncharacterized protein n=1 Tax=Pestalotiopsis fici (strain W106-1 / CGMCC3.15140) TaxID=1229662 RepID=W3WIC0_PESFW|nr:uncharacterized protein PFICI_14475 [Pestalotiopsis fici W106-1]ETS73529.1 hypothetical protein PFICI_14475 [Pestalotiopsis fici W106-1]